MQISVIFTTYNSPDWLEKVLWGYKYQEYKDFEVLVADDGSTSETAEVIRKMQANVDYTIKHIWQEDEGFRKCEILNKAIVASESNYLVFSDGDCVPRKDFLSAHVKHRKENHFLSGGYFKLPMSISKLIQPEDIASERFVNLTWLKEQGLEKSFKNSKLTLKGAGVKFMNAITPTNASWNGHNSSGWKKDVLAINGFDERMRYGAQDREFGERLMNNGLKGIQIRYSAITMHLDHSRGYKNQKDIDFNKNIRAETKAQKTTWTPYGIEKRPAAAT